MREDLDKRLCSEFPLLYRDRHGNKAETCMCWGFPGTGWFHLLYDLSSKLELLIAAQQDDETRARATQVKERFGTLRFYVDYANSEMYACIREAEAKSAVTCEMCGVPGRLREGGWLKTLCDWCDAERQKKRKEDAKKYKEWLRKRKEEREE